MSKSIELTVNAICTYEVTYSVVLNEDDAFLQDYLEKNNLAFDELVDTMGLAEAQELWGEARLHPETGADVYGDLVPVGEEEITSFETVVTEEG